MRSRWPSGLRVSSAMSSPFSLRAASVIGMRSRGRMARSRSAVTAATSMPATATESKAGWFELIVGKSVPSAGDAKCFGFVTSYDTKPKRRLAELLKTQGLQMNQAITFLSDGGDNVRDLQLYLSPLAEHLLDWFHITMRITVLRQQLKELIAAAPDRDLATLDGELERVKWYLWHGNVFRALQVVEQIQWQLEELDEEGCPSPIAGASPGAERGFAADLRALVSRDDQYGRFSSGGSVAAPGLE